MTSDTAIRTPSVRVLLRFDGVQRTAHWVNAGLFLTLMFTAIPLYYGSFFGVVFPRHDIQMIHLWCGLALPVPILVSLAGPWGRRMRADVRRVSYWTRNEIEWLRTLGRTPIKADKFNPGQKANAIFTAAAIAVLFVSGYILQWFRFFPVSWRAGATFSHDIFALAVFIAVAGHVVLAVTHPQSLKSMFTGKISERWAARRASTWLAEDPETTDH
ncbi:MAG TPA: cytochrome b/b6 domain-containing protein [Acidimicrobiales bacterium]|nr:cytochrome b/b6 domain-containing protein [Acidimicrobiales bacterium]